MASSETSRTLPPLTPPPPRGSSGSYAQIDVGALEARRSSSEHPRPASGFAPADPHASRSESDAPPAVEVFRPGAFAPEHAIDEQIGDLERWAAAHLNRNRRDKTRFWVLRGLGFLTAASAAASGGLGLLKPTVVFGALSALCIAIDSAWPSDSFRNVHLRAVYDLRELQNTLKLRWDKVRLAHPDPNASQRTAHALALLDQVQNKRDEIGKYLGSAEPSPGIKR